jgi:hypothetical protein
LGCEVVSKVSIADDTAAWLHCGQTGSDLLEIGLNIPRIILCAS